METGPTFWDIELSIASTLAQSEKETDLEQARAIYEAFLRHPSGTNERQLDAWGNYAKLANKLRLSIDPSLKPEPGRPGVPVIILEPPIRIGGVDTAVISLYGEPTERSGDPLQGETLKYGTRGLMFTIQNGKLQAIAMLYPSSGAVDGVRVGDKLSAVERQFGKAGATAEESGYTKWRYPARGVTVTSKDKVVTRIDIKEPSP